VIFSRLGDLYFWFRALAIGLFIMIAFPPCNLPMGEAIFIIGRRLIMILISFSDGR